MREIKTINTAVKLALVALTGLQLACSSSDDASVSAAETTISGYVVAAPVSGATVSITDAAGNDIAGPVTTDAAGLYSLKVADTSLNQDLIIYSTGGTFTDEATGSSGSAADMYAYTTADSMSNAASVSVTPGSTIIARLVSHHNKTMAEAQQIFAEAFAYTPDVSVIPADATAPAADATPEELLAGFRAAAFSQLTMDLGLAPDDQFALFAALARDLSDDRLDGVDASAAVAIGTTGKELPADIQNRFATAMINFSANANNNTGLDNAQIGNLPFGKVVLTDTFRIEYISTGMMEPMEGKSTFQLHITDRVSGADVTGKTLNLMAMMHMATHEHSTPMPEPAISEAGNGLYTVTLYYLMASQMMDGTSMGYWDLKFTVDSEVSHFYPAVMMAMEGADTAQVRLKGVDDKIMSMMTGDMVSRTYIMFNDSLDCTIGTCDFSVFVASQQTMMSFPAVFVDGFLSDKSLTDVRVEISADDGVSWEQAVDGGNGIWAVSGLSLTDGVQDEIRIKLWVELDGVGEYKTTDGMVLDPGVNDYQTFKVTPGGM